MYANNIVTAGRTATQLNVHEKENNTENSGFTDGSTVEGIITEVSDKITVDFGTRTADFSKSSISGAAVGQKRSFEVISASGNKIILKEKQKDSTVSYGIKNTKINTGSGLLFVNEGKETLDKKSGALYGNLENFMDKEDYSALENDEESPLEKYNSERLERAIERVKRQRKEREQSIENQKQKLDDDREQAEKTASYDAEGLGGIIADRLNEAGIPANEENVKRVMEAVQKCGTFSDMSAASKNYIIKNGQEATIDNLYKAAYSAFDGRSQNQAAVSDYDSIRTAVLEVINQAGFEPSEYLEGVAKEFLTQDIPVTKENFILRSKLDMISDYSAEDMIDFAVNSISEGKQADAAVITGITRQRAEKAVETFRNIADSAAAGAVNEAESKGTEITLELLEKYNNYGSKDAEGKDITEAFAENKLNTDAEAKTITVRRQLEEIRLKLTVESGMRLSALGVEIDTSGLEDIVDGLRQLENRLYEKLLQSCGLAADEENIGLLGRIAQSVETVSQAPAYILGATFEQNVSITVESLSAVAETAVAEAKKAAGVSYEHAVNNYEKVMTKPRADMGDSIEKAFRNTDDILESLELAATKENERAVRILGYNNIEINKDNIELMKYYDTSVRHMVELMQPEVTVQMIKSGLNPLNMTVAEVCKEAGKLTDTLSTAEEKYSSYIVKLENENSITKEERNAYIGIYRLLYQIEKSDGAATGAVINAGKELTLSNLLEAVRTKKEGRFDESVSDKSGQKSGGYTNDIAYQINSAYADMQVRVTSDNAMPWRLADVVKKDGQNIAQGMENIMNMPLEELGEQLRFSGAVPSEGYAEKAFENFKDTYEDAVMAGEFLLNNGIEDSQPMLAAAKELVSGRAARHNNYAGVSGGISADELPETEDELAKLLSEYYDEAYENTGKALEGIVPEEMNAETADKYRMALYGIKLAGNLVQKGFYEIPVKTGDTITNINLTLMRDGSNSGKVSINFNTPSGEVNLSVQVSRDLTQCLVTAHNVTALDLIKAKEDLLRNVLEDMENVSGAIINYTVDTGSQLSIFKESIYKTAGLSEAVQNISENSAGTKSGNEKVNTDTDTLFKLAAELVGVLAEQ